MQDIRDISAFLNPISDDERCGVFLRYEPVYDQIQHARLEDDVRLSMGVWERDLKRADWGFVKDKCTDILQTRSKDFQVCVWLAEAWSILHSWDGVSVGVGLLLQFCEQFWDDAYPSLDGDDNDARSMPFTFFSTKYADRLLSLPIFVQDEAHNVLLSDLYDASYGGNIDYIVASYRHRVDDLHALSGVVQSALNDVEKLDDFLHEKLGDSAPSMRILAERLDKVLRYLQNLVERVANDVVVDGADVIETKPLITSGDNNTEELELRVNSLDEAYSALDELHKYLSQTASDHASVFLLKVASEMRGITYESLLKSDKDLVQAFCTIGNVSTSIDHSS